MGSAMELNATAARNREICGSTIPTARQFILGREPSKEVKLLTAIASNDRLLPKHGRADLGKPLRVCVNVKYKRNFLGGLRFARSAAIRA
jgi:hypothetical protein